MNVAVMGLGWWGPKLVRNFIQHPEFDQVYGFDQDRNILNIRASELQFQALGSIEEIWKNSRINAVVIVTPVQTHYKLTKAALEHGKHVLVAKPPASTPQEVEELGQMAQKTGLVYMADSTFVYSAAVQKMREEIKAGTFPNLRSVQSLRLGDDMRMHHVSRIRNTMFANGVDVIEDLIFHDLSVLFSLLEGDFHIHSVQRFYNLHPTLCDTAYIDLNVGDVRVHIGYSWTLPERKRELVLYDPEKFLVFDDLQKEEKLWIYHLESQKKERLSFSQGEPLFNVVDHFAQCIKNGKEPVTGITLMLKVMHVAERVRHWGNAGS